MHQANESARPSEAPAEADWQAVSVSVRRANILAIPPFIGSVVLVMGPYIHLLGVDSLAALLTCWAYPLMFGGIIAHEGSMRSAGFWQGSTGKTYASASSGKP